MEIRSLIPPPWMQMVPLVAASREEGYLFLVRLEHEYLSGQVRFDGTGETLLGALEGPAIIGVAGLTQEGDGTDRQVGRVRHVYVSPEFRGRGIGKALLLEIERRARAHFRELVLRTDTSDAARFSQRIGYELLDPGGTATHRRALNV